jgi:hypothetical protein
MLHPPRVNVPWKCPTCHRDQQAEFRMDYTGRRPQYEHAGADMICAGCGSRYGYRTIYSQSKSFPTELALTEHRLPDPGSP